MGEVNIRDALDRIESSSVKERAEGLADLKHILRHNQRSSRVETLQDQAFHKVYETLFRVASAERSQYLKAAKTTVKSTIANRLSSCASVLRLSVEAGVRNLQLKTVKAILDHLVEALPGGGEDLCEPLATEYIKCLGVVLGNQAHVEHLQQKGWDRIVDFCLDIIQRYDHEPESGDAGRVMSFSISRSWNDANSYSPHSANKGHGRSSQNASLSIVHVEGLILCLRHLTSAPNAPILPKARALGSTMIAFSRGASTTARAHQNAFAIVNSVLAHTKLNAKSLTDEFMCELIPLIKRLWMSKTVPLKHDLLVTLIHLEPYISTGLEKPENKMLSLELQQMVDAMQKEYVKRAERDRLHSEDLRLDFNLGETLSAALTTNAAFSLRNSTSRAEQGWFLMQFVATFYMLLDKHAVVAVSEDPESLDGPTAKKRRIARNFDDILRQCRDQNASVRACSLQVLAFMSQATALSMEDMSQLLDKLTLLASDNDASVASWAFIVSTSCATQLCSGSATLSEYWYAMWQAAHRTINVPSVSRAACHATNAIIGFQLVAMGSVTECVDSSLTSPELNGPALLCDSALAFWINVLRLSNAQSTASLQASERVLGWLFRKWMPSNFDNRVYASQHAHADLIDDILSLVHTCIDRPWHSRQPKRRFVLGHLAQVAAQDQGLADLLSYLVLVTPVQPFLRSAFDLAVSSPAASSGSNSFSSSQSIVLGFSITELTSTLTSWVHWAGNRPQNISADMLRVVSIFCCVMYAVSTLNLRDTRRLQQVQSGAKDLLQGICDYLTKSECEKDKLDALLEVFAHLLLPGAGTNNEVTPLPDVCMRDICQYISAALDTRRRSTSSDSVEDAYESMDNDDGGFDSQRSQGRARTEHLLDLRHDMPARYDSSTILARVSAYTSLQSSLHTAELSRGSSETSFSMFVDYVMGLPPAEVLACREVLARLSELDIHLQVKDIYRLLDHMSESYLRNYAYERSEVALGLVLDLMTGFLDVWATSTDNGLCNLGLDLYEWFTTVALASGIASMHVQQRIATMLIRLLPVNPDYGQNADLPSVRTSLFKVLQAGDVSVKHHVAKQIPNIFALYVLARHEAVFEDLQNSLPNDVDWVEGIAIRLLILSELASRWHTLLRRCVYHIFETAGQIRHSVQYASCCMTRIATALGFSDTQAVCRVFAPQMLYTWLEYRALADIPFSIFGYRELDDLLNDVKIEGFAQLLIRGRTPEVDFLVTRLGLSKAQLLKQSFSKSAAYCIAWDVNAGIIQTSGQPSSEMRLRNLLKSKEEYLSLLTTYFPAILALFMVATQEDDQQSFRAFDKRPGYRAVSVNLKEMRDHSSSNRALPSTQQPSFKAKHLLDQVERLCRRTGLDAAKIWTPAVFSVVARSLLDCIDPSLGSQNTCVIVRKLRLAISLGGDAAQSDYPLDMLLHALQPLVADAECADDVLGIVHYLYVHGKSSLEQRPSFLSGLAVLTLMSLTSFMHTGQDSTTQTSQFSATMSVMHKFKGWFAEYLRGYNGISDTTAKLHFHSMIDAACATQLPGGATVDSPAAVLLREILDDERSGRDLLLPTYRQSVINLLCRDFLVPSTPADDVFGSDDEATAYAPYVWSICNRTGIGDSFRLWAAMVCGRAYSSQGRLELKSNEQNASSTVGFGRTATCIQGQPRSSIVQKLAKLLLHGRTSYVSLTETTIRSITGRCTDPQAAIDFAQMLDASVHSALLAADIATLAQPFDEDALRGGRPPENLRHTFVSAQTATPSSWIQDLSLALVGWLREDPICGALDYIVTRVDGLAESLFPFLVHVALESEIDQEQTVRQVISEACVTLFSGSNETSLPQCRLFLDTLLYLRRQPIPHEVTKADRGNWLEVDEGLLAESAYRCGMYTAALLFAETAASHVTHGTRRSSVTARLVFAVQKPLLLSIFRQIGDPDSFYGIEQQPSLSSVLDRLDHEADGFKSLSFRSAYLDSQMQLHGPRIFSDDRGLLKSLSSLNLNSVTHALLGKKQGQAGSPDSIDSMLQTAQRLGQWDIQAPDNHQTHISITYRAFQSLSNSQDVDASRNHLHLSLVNSATLMRDTAPTSPEMYTGLINLAILTDAEEVLSCTSSTALSGVWLKLQSRQKWMGDSRRDAFENLLSSQKTLFTILAQNDKLRNGLHTNVREMRLIESRALLASSSILRRHNARQESLVAATYLSDLVSVLETSGLNIAAAAQLEVASVLWDFDERVASVKMLQEIRTRSDIEDQAIPVGRSGLLAKLGHQVATARLEKPDEIIEHYLKPAIQHLKVRKHGVEAGAVFYEFASFCDQQLQNPSSLEDYSRIEKLRQKKLEEVKRYEELLRAAKTKKEKESFQSGYRKAKEWYNLDHAEYERVNNSRQMFVQQSLSNYLLALQACDTYDKSVLRFFSLWLEHATTENANKAIAEVITQVPSHKFAMLMNQLSSRLLNDKSEFQALLATLVTRICYDHPHHSLYQIFASCRNAGPKDDLVASSRSDAAKRISTQLQADLQVGRRWKSMIRACEYYHQVTMIKADDFAKTGGKIALRSVPIAAKMEAQVVALKVPPATIQVALRPSANYDDLPGIVRYSSHIGVATGLSAPKILTANGTDGRQYKQLFKSGNDDLRQDAIMEQVFEEVSKLLRNHEATRQRDLHVRTYKVLPLTSGSGIIEFVPHSIPLHDFLMPAHQRYYPKDLKPNSARERIKAMQNHTTEARVKEFRKTCEKFTPVLRHFFLERFDDPDDWFQKRLAYTRSTAAISMLGHVLGLGDRHCHNILLDEKSGEVVHIDLGVAFETGRVLPVPEVVPFRLTRDIVDGMGITKTEGVFRRCCEFIMDALREEKDSIMTLLDVLRYDPLYSWSVSPVRAKRMQDAQDDTGVAENLKLPGQESKKGDDAGEADRALSVVEKKLSKTLSTAATVNELIQVASDERNLAVLFAGWAAYA
ncbi:Serine/threonine-protein kinase tel1 [Elasticomyces elasticus]|nr:Serine/threonine-protein kinase tel1 [Elasticomyces elasticus]